MAVTLYTNGSIEGVYYTLHAMAVLFKTNSVLFGSMKNIIILLSGLYAAYETVLKQHLFVSFKFFMLTGTAIAFTTLPKVDVIIIDNCLNYRQVVGNVPALFAVPAGVISSIGNSISGTFDDLFSATNIQQDSYSSSRNVAGIHANLIANTSSFEFTDPAFKNNLNNYMSECMYFDVLLGKYSFADLLQSSDIWDLVSKNSSPLGGVVLEDGAGEKKFCNCREASNILSADMRKQLEKSKSFYGRKLFGFLKDRAGNPVNKAVLKHALTSSIGAAYSNLAKISDPADNIILQSMLSNAVLSSIEGKAAQDGASFPINYGIARGKAYQDATFAVQGGIAKQSLSYMLMVIEIVFYALFPIVGLLSLTPAGLRFLKTYFLGLLWLQSWSWLYSVLNMIVTIYARNEMYGVSENISMHTFAQLGQSASSTANYASYAMMSIPFLSWGLLSYGGGALAQLASTMSQPTQSGAAAAASEISSGNLSLGNSSFGNHSRYNTSANKFDDSLFIGNSSASFVKQDGQELIVHPDGSSYLDDRRRIDNTRDKHTETLDISSAQREHLSKSNSSILTEQQSYNEALQLANNKVKQYNERYSNSLSEFTGKSISYGGGVNAGFGFGNKSILNLGMDLKGHLNYLNNAGQNISDSKQLEEFKSISDSFQELNSISNNLASMVEKRDAYAKNLELSSSRGVSVRRDVTHLNRGGSVDELNPDFLNNQTSLEKQYFDSNSKPAFDGKIQEKHKSVIAKKDPFLSVDVEHAE